MPVALRELLDAAAPTSGRRVDPAVVWGRGRRRRRRRRLVVGAGIVVVVALGGSALALLLRDPDTTVSTNEGTPTPQPSPALPNGWTTTTENLTPGLVEPAQVFAAATYPLRPNDGEQCSHLPMNAIQDLGPGDGLIWVAERPNGDLRGFPPLDVPPASDSPDRNSDESSECLSEPKEFERWWISFSVGTRTFYGYVAFGSEVEAATRDEAWAILAGFSPPSGLPDRWTDTTENLTPTVTEPHQVFAAATYPLQPGGPDSLECAGYPLNAIEDLGPTDGLVWVVQTPNTGYLNPADQWPPLAVPPAADSPDRNSDESRECLAEPMEFEHWLIPFSIDVRLFYAYVAFGTDADAWTRGEAWAMLAGFSPEPEVSPTELSEQAARALPAALTLGLAEHRDGNSFVEVEAGGAPWGTVTRAAPPRWRDQRPEFADVETGRIRASYAADGGIEAVAMIDDEGWLVSIDVSASDVPQRYDEPAAVSRGQLEVWLAETVQPNFTANSPVPPPVAGLPGEEGRPPLGWNSTPVSPRVRTAIGIAVGGEAVEVDLWLVAGNDDGPGLCYGEPARCLVIMGAPEGRSGSSSDAIYWTVGPDVAAIAFNTVDGARYEIPVARPFADLGVRNGVVEAQLPCDDILGTVDHLASDGSVVESVAPPCTAG